MPASHQLDLLLVSAEPTAVSRGCALLERLRAESVIDGTGAPGPSARRWSAGTFARIRVDDPGREVLYANRQGGFQVRCPVGGEPIVRAFEAAVTRWRASEPGARQGPRFPAFPAQETTNRESGETASRS